MSMGTHLYSSSSSHGKIKPFHDETVPSVSWAYLSHFIDLIPVPVVLLSCEGRIRDANSAFLADIAHGNTRQSAWIGKPFLECLGKNLPDMHDAIVKVLSQNTVDIPRVRLECGSPGPGVTVSFHGAPIVSMEGKQEGALLVLTNITKQENLENRLAQAQKMEAIGRLAGGIAHDFNNLLTGILGYSSLLKTSLPDPSEEYEAASYIERAGKRAAELTRQLLAYSRREPAVSRPVNIEWIVNEAVQILSRTVNKNVSILCEFQSERSVIKGDPAALMQALLNLGINSNDAMPDGGELVFFTRNVVFREDTVIQGLRIPRGEYVSLRVSDTGTGIPEEIRGKIFEPFFTTKEPGRGTGLGLSMVYGCIKSHGGYIFHENREVAGTVFEILLSPTDEKEEQVAEPRHAPSIVRGSGTILVVDDEEIPLSLACDVLNTLGYSTISASSGEDGVDIFRRNVDRIDAVILDKIMPGMDGTETLRRIRLIAPGIPAILCSGYTEGAAGNKELMQAFSAFLPKPYKVEEMANTVRGVLGRTSST